MLQSHWKLLHHLARPARGGAAAVIAIFAILLGVCAQSILGLPLALVLFSWFFRYAFILFDHTVRGFDEPPVLDINMMNPYGELRPTFTLIIIGGMTIAVWSVNTHIGRLAASAIIVPLALLLPASVTLLAIEGNALRAISPLACYEIIKGLGLYYWLSLGLIAAEGTAITLLGKLPLGLIFQLAAGMFGTLSTFSLLAGAIYERRDQIGLVAWISPELEEEKSRREEHQRDVKTITEAYGLMRAGRHVDSWQVLQAWLQSQGFQPQSYRWLTEQTDRWEDPRYSTRLTEDWIERLMQLRRSGDGLTVVIQRLRLDPTFRPRSGADTLTLAQLAARGGGSPRTARVLLSDFAQRFPADPRVGIAAELARHLQ